jgi:hypothetical protein
MYKSLDAADHADVRIAAFITDGNPVKPAALIAMTKGLAAAVPSERLRLGLSEGTRRPMMNTRGSIHVNIRA